MRCVAQIHYGPHNSLGHFQKMTMLNFHIKSHAMTLGISKAKNYCILDIYHFKLFSEYLHFEFYPLRCSNKCISKYTSPHFSKMILPRCQNSNPYNNTGLKDVQYNFHFSLRSMHDIPIIPVHLCRLDCILLSPSQNSRSI